MKLILILAAVLLTACSNNPKVPEPVLAADLMKPPAQPNVELEQDKFIRSMTRNEVIMAINECEGNGTRAVVINGRRKINGYSTEVVIDVTCAPRGRF